MNILLSWARKQSDPDVGILINRLEKEGHHIVYFVGSPIDKRSTPAGAVFHSYADAENGYSALGIDPTSFEPLSEGLVQKLYRTESIMLTMMNRFFDRACVDERRRMYYEMVRYWNGILQTFKPSAVIFPNMPHFGYDYLIYELAQLAGIRTIFFDDTRFPGRLLPATNFDRLTERLQKALERNTGQRYSLEDIAPDIRHYYEPRSRRDFNSVPSYIADQKERHSFWKIRLSWKHIWRSMRDFSVFRKVPRYLRFLVREETIPFIKKL